MNGAVLCEWASDWGVRRVEEGDHFQAGGRVFAGCGGGVKEEEDGGRGVDWAKMVQPLLAAAAFLRCHSTGDLHQAH